MDKNENYNYTIYIRQIINNKYSLMNTQALITMVLTQGIVTFFALYFFYKVLTTPPKPEPDSFSENDDVVVRQIEE